MAPTSVGIVAAAKALQDEGLCEEVKVSGLGVPAEMVEYTLNGCAPEFALWSFVDLGYLTYYVVLPAATGAIQGVEGETFEVGRPISGEHDVHDQGRPDPARLDGALRVLMGRSRSTTPTTSRLLRAEPASVAARPPVRVGGPGVLMSGDPAAHR